MCEITVQNSTCYIMNKSTMDLLSPKETWINNLKNKRNYIWYEALKNINAYESFFGYTLKHLCIMCYKGLHIYVDLDRNLWSAQGFVDM